MRVCYLRNPGPNAPSVGADWARVLDADVLAPAELESAARAGERRGAHWPYDVALLDVEADSLEQVAATRRILGGTRCLLIALVTRPRPTTDRDAWKAALSAADLVLAPQYGVCLELREELGIPAYELTPPFTPEPHPDLVPPALRRSFTVVARPGYSHWRLVRELGVAAYLATRARFRIEIVDAAAPDLPARVRRSAFVYLPEPIDDGGALAGECAAAGALLVAHRAYDPAKITFPYTTFDTRHRHRRMALLFWLYSSKDFTEFFRDNARRAVVHLDDSNRRVQFHNRIAYRFPDLRYAPKPGAPPALLDQIHHSHGPREIDYAEDECAVVCLVRNGEEHLPSFLAHYRALGVKHFVFIDNGSDDATLPLLRSARDVTIYETALPHKHFENEMRRLIIEQHCRNRFCLNVDVDELFDYPLSDRVRLPELLRYLRRQGATAMAGYMLDMFDKENTFAHAGTLDLKSAYPYYNLGNITKLDYYSDHVNAYCDYNVLGADHVKCCFGGIRKTIFKSKTGGHYLLTKHPLFFLDGTLEPVTNPHYCNKAKVADVTCVLYHYKFTPSFQAKVNESRAAKRYVKFAQNQYDEYHKLIDGKRSLRIDPPGTRRLDHVSELVDLGFLSVSPTFEAYARQLTRERSQPARVRLESIEPESTNPNTVTA